MSEKILFCQVDAHLDTNPKIVKAASGFATALYQFFLRRVKVLGTDGWVPASNADPAYLARLLHFPEEEMSRALSRLSQVDLVTIRDTRDIAITGWSDEWSGTSRANKRLPMTPEEKRERERLRKEKQRKGAKDAVPCPASVPPLSADVPLSRVVPPVPHTEERRGEEIRGDQKIERDARAGQSRGSVAHGWWTYGRETHLRLRPQVDPQAPAAAWALQPASSDSGWQLCLARVDEVLASSDAPDAPLIGRHAIDVAAERAKDLGHLNFLIPVRVFEPVSFGKSKGTSLRKPSHAAAKHTGRVEPTTDPNAFTDGERKL